MFKPIERHLSVAQHEKLDMIGRQNPDARVVGWSSSYEGPIVRHEDGALRTVTRLGRTIRSRRHEVPIV